METKHVIVEVDACNFVEVQLGKYQPSNDNVRKADANGRKENVFNFIHGIQGDPQKLAPTKSRNPGKSMRAYESTYLFIN